MKIFSWLVEQVTEARRTGDVEKKQSAAGRGVQAAGEQQVREAHRSLGAANKHYLHQRREGSRRSLAKRVFL